MPFDVDICLGFVSRRMFVQESHGSSRIAILPMRRAGRKAAHRIAKAPTAKLGGDDTAVEARMRAWLQRAIVDMELCPFARPVLPKTRVFVSHSAKNSQQFWDELLDEVRSLEGATGAAPPACGAWQPTTHN